MSDIDSADSLTYKIVRKYFRDDLEDELIAEGLSLEEAQAHCNDPETSYQKCVSHHAGSENLDPRFDGPWFDAYYEE